MFRWVLFGSLVISTVTSSLILYSMHRAFKFNCYAFVCVSCHIMNHKYSQLLVTLKYNQGINQTPGRLQH